MMLYLGHCQRNPSVFVMQMIPDSKDIGCCLNKYYCKEVVLLFILFVATTTKDFRQQSFIEWRLKEKFYQEQINLPYQTHLQMMFRTRQHSGFLFMAHNQHKSKHVILEVGCKLQY